MSAPGGRIPRLFDRFDFVDTLDVFDVIDVFGVFDVLDASDVRERARAAFRSIRRYTLRAAFGAILHV